MAEMPRASRAPAPTAAIRVVRAVMRFVLPFRGSVLTRCPLKFPAA
jgi:hypothetical protein